MLASIGDRHQQGAARAYLLITQALGSCARWGISAELLCGGDLSSALLSRSTSSHPCMGKCQITRDRLWVRKRTLLL